MVTCQIKKINQTNENDEELRKALLEVKLPKGMTLDEAVEYVKRLRQTDDCSSDEEDLLLIRESYEDDC